MELIGVKFGPNGLIWPELWPVSPSKFCKLVLENGLCSHVPGIIGQKFLQHLFSRAFLVKISLLLVQSVGPVGRQTPFLAEIGPF